jgi:5-(carboxyamino)imidazole ribonucleotide mutase
MNAALLAIQILAGKNPGLQVKLSDYKENLKAKIVKANEELSSVKYKFKTN